MTFEQSLRAAIQADPARRRRARRIQEVLDMRPGRRRQRVLDRMARHAAAALGEEPSAIDWSQVDWAKVFDLILKVLLALLPLLLV